MKLRRIIPGRTDPSGKGNWDHVRESTRIPFAIPIIIRGKDERSRTFKENTQTIDVSRRGARLVTLQHLPLDSAITIENHALGRSAVAKVVRKGERRSPRKPVEIGITLLEVIEPESIWGLKAPPKDWVEGSRELTPAERLEYVLAQDRAAVEDLPSEGTKDFEPEVVFDADSLASALEEELGNTQVAEEGRVQPQVPKERDVRGLASSAAGFETLPPPAKASQSTPTTAGDSLESLKMMADEILADAPPVGKTPKRLDQEPTSHHDLTFEEHAETARSNAEATIHSVNLAAEEAVVRLQTAQQKMEADIDARAQNYQKKLADLSSTLDGFQGRSASFLEDFQSELDSTLRGFQQKGAKEVADLQKISKVLLEHSTKQLQDQADVITKKLSGEIKTLGQTFVEETKKQLTSMAQASVETLAKATDQEHSSHLLQALQEQAQTARRNAEEAIKSIDVAAEGATSRLQGAQQKIEAAFATLAEKYQKRLGELSSALEGLQGKSTSLLEDFERQLDNKLRGLQKKGAEEVGGEVERRARELLENSAKQIQQQADATAKRLAEELNVSGHGLVEQAKNQIAGIAQASLQYLAKTANEEYGSRLIQQFQEQADAIAMRLSEELKGSRQELVEQAKNQIASVTQASLQTLAKRADEEYGTRLTQKLHEQGDTTARRMIEAVRTSGQELVEEARNQISAVTQASLQSLVKRADEEYGSRLAQKLQEQTQIARRNADTAVNSVNLASDEAVAKVLRAQQNADSAVQSINLAAEDAVARLLKAQQKIEANFEAHAEHYRKQLAELSSTLEGLQGKSSALLQDFQSQLQSTLRGLQQKGAKELGEEVEKLTKSLLERSSRQLQDQASANARKLGEDLRVSGQAYVDTTKKELAAMTQGSLDTLTKATVERCRGDLREMFDAFAARSIRQLEAEHEERLEKYRATIESDIASLPPPNLEESYRKGFRQRPGTRRLLAAMLIAVCVIIMVPFIVAIYLSTRPVMRLRSEAPADFVDVRPDWPLKRRAKEEQLARAYWECALRVAPARYQFGVDLPEEPPPDFKVDESELLSGSAKDDAEARAHYWAKFRQVWGLPQAWEELSGWNTEWIHNLFGSVHAKTR